MLYDHLKWCCGTHGATDTATVLALTARQWIHSESATAALLLLRRAAEDAVTVTNQHTVEW